MKKPNDRCGYCYGAWNGMDRWFMQPCVCAKRCAEPKCSPADPTPGPTEER